MNWTQIILLSIAMLVVVIKILLTNKFRPTRKIDTRFIEPSEEPTNPHYFEPHKLDYEETEKTAGGNHEWCWIRKNGKWIWVRKPIAINHRNDIFQKRIRLSKSKIRKMVKENADRLRAEIQSI